MINKYTELIHKNWDTATEEQTIYYYKDFCKNFLKTIIERAEKYGITLNNGGGRSIID